MQKVSQQFSVPNLTKANVLDIAPEVLKQIRLAAFRSIANSISKSQNNFEFVSTSGTFRVKHSMRSAQGRIKGLELEHIEIIKPDLVVVLIADLVEVKRNLVRDEIWSKRTKGELSLLAEWRRETIDSALEDSQDYFVAQGKDSTINTVIFAKSHAPATMAELCLGTKPRIYISFAITNAKQSSINQVSKIRGELERQFVCLDPNAIKDWEIIREYDKAIERGKKTITISAPHTILNRSEVEQAIDDIRIQTVNRDYSLITSSHATVVLHVTQFPSYGVMAEVIKTSQYSNRCYVLYPFKTRPSPFFEAYADRENIIQLENIDRGSKALVAKMKADIRSGKWPRWSSKQQNN